MSKIKDAPTLREAWDTVATRKRIGDPRSEILRESADEGGTFRSSKIGRIVWKISFYRESMDGNLRALFQVNGRPVLGLDFHRLSSRDARGGMVPPGYHWDVHPPFVERKDKFGAELASLTAAVVGGDVSQIDRAALAMVCKFWHVRFEREARPVLPRGRQR